MFFFSVYLSHKHRHHHITYSPKTKQLFNDNTDHKKTCMLNISVTVTAIHSVPSSAKYF